MSDPQNAEIEGYITPSQEQLRARKRRNRAIALALAGWVVAVFVVMVFKIGVLSA